MFQFEHWIQQSHGARLARRAAAACLVAGSEQPAMVFTVVKKSLGILRPLRQKGEDEAFRCGLVSGRRTRAFLAKMQQEMVHPPMGMQTLFPCSLHLKHPV